MNRIIHPTSNGYYCSLIEVVFGFCVAKTSACFAVLCVFALSIVSCSFNAEYSEQNTQSKILGAKYSEQNTQRKDAKDRKAREGSNVARLCRRLGEDRICPFTKIDHRR